MTPGRPLGDPERSDDGDEAFKPRVKLIVPHTVGNEEPGVANWHQWWLPGDFESRDAIGRLNGGSWRSWLRVECNNSECDGAAIIKVNDILAYMEAALPVPEDTPAEISDA